MFINSALFWNLNQFKNFSYISVRTVQELFQTVQELFQNSSSSTVLEHEMGHSAFLNYSCTILEQILHNYRTDQFLFYNQSFTVLTIIQE